MIHHKNPDFYGESLLNWRNTCKIRPVYIEHRLL